MALLPAVCRGGRLIIPVFCSVRFSLPVSSLPSPPLSLSPSRTTALCHYYGARCYATGSHSDSRHWSMERYVSVSLLTLLPAAVLFPSTTVVDYGLAIVLPLHGHWGVQQVITDYVHGPIMNKACHTLLYAVSMGTCLGLLYLNFYDVGVSKAIAKLWSL